MPRRNIVTGKLRITRTSANRITLTGGLGDGYEMIIGWHQRWLCYTKIEVTHNALSLVREQYSPDINGIWRPIDQYHQHYLRMEE